MSEPSKLQKTKSQKLKNLLTVILIGAIGSGLWEIFLKDLVFKLGNFFVNVASLIHSGYIDNLYKDVGKNYSYLEIMPSVFLTTLFVFLPAFAIIRTRRFFQKDEVEEKGNTRFSKFLAYIYQSKRRAYIFILIATIPLSIMYTDMLLRQVSSLSASKHVERILEIVKPYINEQKFDLLRSSFRLVNNKEKLETLITEINMIAKNNNIELPQKRLYGINIFHHESPPTVSAK